MQRRGQLNCCPLLWMSWESRASTRGDIVAGRADSRKLAAAMARMRDQIRRHRDAAQTALSACDPRIGPLYLPARADTALISIAWSAPITRPMTRAGGSARAGVGYMASVAAGPRGWR